MAALSIAAMEKYGCRCLTEAIPVALWGQAVCMHQDADCILAAVADHSGALGRIHPAVPSGGVLCAVAGSLGLAAAFGGRC